MWCVPEFVFQHLSFYSRPPGAGHLMEDLTSDTSSWGWWRTRAGRRTRRRCSCTSTRPGRTRSWPGAAMQAMFDFSPGCIYNTQRKAIVESSGLRKAANANMVKECALFKNCQPSLASLTLGVFCRTAPNMDARVRRVVMAMPVLPGMDSGGRNSDSQDTITKRPGQGQQWIVWIPTRGYNPTWGQISL